MHSLDSIQGTVSWNLHFWELYQLMLPCMQVMSSLSDKERQAVMRFVTSCSRAPLGGFQYLNPPLTLHKVLQLTHSYLLSFNVASGCAFFGINKEGGLVYVFCHLLFILQD